MSIANPHLDKSNPKEKSDMKLRRWTCAASLTVASILIAAKLAAYIITDSVSVMSSLLDSTFDAVASAVTLFSIMHAATPADEEHRFGHGKAEALAALGQAVFIFGSAAFLLYESQHRFVHPQPVKGVYVGVAIMILSIVLTIGLVSFQKYTIRKTKSVAISADHLHYKGDLLMNIGVLCALLLSHYSTWPYFDPLFSTIVSVFLLYGGYGISRESYDILMDKELSEEDRVKIEALVRAHPSVLAMHDLRTRQDGQQIFIEFHLEMDGNISLKKAHDITEELEHLIYQKFPKSEVLIHQEPAGLTDHRLDNKIKGPLAGIALLCLLLPLSACQPKAPPPSFEVKTTAPLVDKSTTPDNLLYCNVGRGTALFGKEWYDFDDKTFTLQQNARMNLKISRTHGAEEMSIQVFFDNDGQKLIFCPFVKASSPAQRIACSSLYALDDDLHDGLKRTFDIPNAIRGGSISCAYKQEKVKPLTPPTGGGN